MIKELNESIIGKLAVIRIPFDSMPINTIIQIVGISTNNSVSDSETKLGDTYISGEWYDYDVLLRKIDNVNYGEHSNYFHGCTRKFLVKERLVYRLPLYYYAPHHVLELITND